MTGALLAPRETRNPALPGMTTDGRTILLDTHQVTGTLTTFFLGATMVANAFLPSVVANLADQVTTLRMPAADLTSAVLRPKPEPPAARNSAEQVQLLHVGSGLTWEQLSKLFGVSRRAMHLWAGGGRMSSVNERRLGMLIRFITDLGNDAAARRAALSAPRPGGLSYYDLLRGTHRDAGEPDVDPGW